MTAFIHWVGRANISLSGREVCVCVCVCVWSDCLQKPMKNVVTCLRVWNDGCERIERICLVTTSSVCCRLRKLMDRTLCVLFLCYTI